MHEEKSYKVIGPLIYRTMRILGRLETLCKVLEHKLGQENSGERAVTNPLDELNELADRAVALFAQAYGADSVLVREVADQMAALRARCIRLGELVADSTDTLADDGEFNRLVACEQNLERLHQTVSAA